MKGIARDMQRLEVFIGHDDPGGIGALVVLRFNSLAFGLTIVTRLLIPRAARRRHSVQDSSHRL